MQNSYIKIRVTEQFKKEIEEAAKKSKRTTSNFIKVVLEEKLEEIKKEEP